MMIHVRPYGNLSPAKELSLQSNNFTCPPSTIYISLYLCKIKQRSREGGFLTSGGCRPLLSTISLLKSPAAFSRALLFGCCEKTRRQTSVLLFGLLFVLILASRSCPARDRSQLTTRWSDDTNAAFSLTAGASACLPSYVSLG